MAGVPEPAGLLLRDHEPMRALVHAIDGIAGAMHMGVTVLPEDARCAVACLRGFAQRCHHAKEEVLFPALRRRRIEGAAPVLAELEGSHDRAEQAARELELHVEAASLGDPRGRAAFEAAARRYVPAMVHHLHVEAARLVPLVRKAFARGGGARVAQAIRRIEREAMPDDGMHQVAADIHGLAVRYARFAPARSIAAA
jgi:hemerythrin-like domain-containing protein